MKIVLEISPTDFKKLSDYLSAHEIDIAFEINDFADLHGLFVAIFDQEPVKQ